MRNRLIYFIVTALSACGEPSSSRGYVYGEVDPLFTKYMADYEAWDKSCEPGDEAREAGIEAGTGLLKVDAMRCAYNRLLEQEPLEPENRKTKAKLMATLYGMTGDKTWLTTEFCDVERGERGSWLIELSLEWSFAALQPSYDVIIVPEEFTRRQYDVLECKGDWELPDFTAPNDPG
ncbi:MAG: hypothetical protein AAF950_12040 [Pseudomonadota bacterium]